MRVAFIHSNDKLKLHNIDISGRVLFGGPLLSTAHNLQDEFMQVST